MENYSFSIETGYNESIPKVVLLTCTFAAINKEEAEAFSENIYRSWGDSITLDLPTPKRVYYKGAVSQV